MIDSKFTQKFAVNSCVMEMYVCRSLKLLNNVTALCKAIELSDADAVNSMSGLLINDLSDHKMNFTWHKNNSYIENVNKLVEIETGMTG